MIAMLTILMMGLFQSDTKTEHQKYEVITSQKEFEIRYYPPAILASVDMGGSYDQSRNSGFGTLAGYIFGGNEQNMQISMTAPVRITESERIMSFVMPSEYSIQELPKPKSSKVKLHTSEPQYVAVVRFGGWASDRKISEMKTRLSELIKQAGLKHNGKFEFLGYNPPYQLANRRNEVLVPLLNFDPAQFLSEKK